ITSLDSDESIRAGQKLLLKAIAEQAGSKGEPQLPFDEAEVIKSAFGGLNADEVEQDDQEIIEDQGLSDLDRLRRHMVVVHGHDQTEIDQFEVADVRQMHGTDHELGVAGMMPHDPDWWEWRRIVVAERTAELHGQGIRWGEDSNDIVDDQPL